MKPMQLWYVNAAMKRFYKKYVQCGTKFLWEFNFANRRFFVFCGN